MEKGYYNKRITTSLFISLQSQSTIKMEKGYYSKIAKYRINQPGRNPQ